MHVKGSRRHVKTDGTRCSLVRGMSEILQELFVFFTSSPKRYAVFRAKVSEEGVENPLGLRNLSAIRLVVGADSIRAHWSSYEEIVHALTDRDNFVDEGK